MVNWAFLAFIYLTSDDFIFAGLTECSRTSPENELLLGWMLVEETPTARLGLGFIARTVAPAVACLEAPNFLNRRALSTPIVEDVGQW